MVSKIKIQVKLQISKSSSSIPHVIPIRSNLNRKIYFSIVKVKKIVALEVVQIYNFLILVVSPKEKEMISIHPKTLKKGTICLFDAEIVLFHAFTLCNTNYQKT